MPTITLAEDIDWKLGCIYWVAENLDKSELFNLRTIQITEEQFKQIQYVTLDRLEEVLKSI